MRRHRQSRYRRNDDCIEQQDRKPSKVDVAPKGGYRDFDIGFPGNSGPIPTPSANAGAGFVNLAGQREIARGTV